MTTYSECDPAEPRMLAFHDCEVPRDQLMAFLEEHRGSDRIVGTGGSEGEGYGISHAVRYFRPSEDETNRYALYEALFGIPEPLARIEELIFTRLPPERAIDWPLLFVLSIQRGADLSSVTPSFLYRLVARRRESLVDLPFTDAFRSRVGATMHPALALLADWRDSDHLDADARWREAARKRIEAERIAALAGQKEKVAKAFAAAKSGARREPLIGARGIVELALMLSAGRRVTQDDLNRARKDAWSSITRTIRDTRKKTQSEALARSAYLTGASPGTGTVKAVEETTMSAEHAADAAGCWAEWLLGSRRKMVGVTAKTTAAKHAAYAAESAARAARFVAEGAVWSVQSEAEPSTERMQKEEAAAGSAKEAEEKEYRWMAGALIEELERAVGLRPTQNGCCANGGRTWPPATPRAAAGSPSGEVFVGTKIRAQRSPVLK
jgi:hypothetical protein